MRIKDKKKNQKIQKKRKKVRSEEKEGGGGGGGITFSLKAKYFSASVCAKPALLLWCPPL